MDADALKLKDQKMSLYFSASNPGSLLASFKKAIDAGHATTWAYDAEGDFTHTPQQWNKLAWMRPLIGAGQLAFSIIKPQSKPITWEVYGVYHGRLAESVTIHCNESFSTVTGTSKPTNTDIVGT